MIGAYLNQQLAMHTPAYDAYAGQLLLLEESYLDNTAQKQNRDLLNSLIELYFVQPIGDFA
jgi:hypothetical protein